MDDSSTSEVNKTEIRIPLGLNSFGEIERRQFGQNIRLAMGCIEGSSTPVKTKAMPSDELVIRQRLKLLSQEITSYHADLLELLVRFDDLQGWQTTGASHCAAWMNLEIGISLQLGWEYLRVGRRLRSLPTTTALFRAGKLSWSKIRLIARVADAVHEKTLCHAALDASVSEVKRLCDGYRWKDEHNGDGENERALKQWESRSLSWNESSNGSTRIQLTLPPEIAQAFLNSVEHSLKQFEQSEGKISQRRADAAVLMAETSLQSAGRDFAAADRYQVIVSVEASDLTASITNNTVTKNTAEYKHAPSTRPTVIGAGPIACETARRIACDCSISTITASNGEPVDIGRKSRIWPNAMSRAIKNRDQHCQYPGCNQTQNLHIHHLTHWADGGSTCMSNGACLCSFHHTMVHEGDYTIQRIDSSTQRLDEQFAQQKHADDISMFHVEKELRNDRQSFTKVRNLSPTRYRFRVVDAHGNDIRDIHNVQTATKTDTKANVDYCGAESSLYSRHSTRVECAEPVASYYLCRYRSKHGTRGEAVLH